MANFDGFAPFEITRFSSLVEKDDPTALPLGVLTAGRNIKFHLGSVRTRDGIQNQYGFVLPDKSPVTGLLAQKIGQASGDDLQVPIALAALGNLYIESPAGSGQVIQIGGPLVDLRKPITFTDSFLPPRALPLGQDYVFDQANGYVLGADGLQQPVPGTGVSWNLLLTGNNQTNLTASITIPTFNVAISNFSAGVFGRYQGTPDSPIAYYEAGLSASAPNIAIYKVDATGIQVLAFQNVLAIPDNSTLTLRITGATIEALLNGIVILTVVDPDPILSGTTGLITTGPPVSGFSSSAYSSDPVSMQAAAAFKCGYLAFTDLLHAYARPAVYNPTLGNLDPLSMKQVGQLWTPGTFYNAGEVITPAPFVNGAASVYPVGGNGHSYRCTVPGFSGGVQPVFPITEGGVVAEAGSTLTWTENTPVMAQAITTPTIPIVAVVPGAGTFAAGRDVYLSVTLINSLGETDPSPYFVRVNTVLNDRLAVSSPVIAAWLAAVAPTFVPSGYNVYEADVATGGGIPAFSTFKKVAGGPFALGAVTNVDAAAAGAAPPVLNSALIVPVGNICFGLRYMVVLFINRNGYICGMTEASVVSYNSPTSGYKLYTARIPIGPENAVARICAFTPAGQLNQLAGSGISNAGPYFWIPPAFANGIFDLSAVPPGVTITEVVNGVPMTSTLINDNVTTTAFFNFTDDYLKSQVLNDVSSFFRKIEVPPCEDVYYAKSIRRMFYATDNLPSGWYVSLFNSPESIYGDTAGIVQCAENNGQNRRAVREFNGVIYLLKEEGGHVLTPNADDPSTWNVKEQWSGSGPCGPRAVDVCKSFMAYAHRSGPHIFRGGTPKVLTEIPDTWKSINWAAEQTIWCAIDDDKHEVHFGVPTGQATMPNVVIKINYEESEESFDTPIYFSRYGKFETNPSSYKFSIDDIPANLAVRAKRTIQTPPLSDPPTIDNDAIQSQLLYASSNADGAVAASTPFVFNDNGQGIDSYIETPAASRRLIMMKLGGVQLNIDGNGKGCVYVLGARAKDPKSGGLPALPGPPAPGPPEATAGRELKLKKEWEAGIPYACGGRMDNEQIRLRVTNEKRPDVWFDLKWACLYLQPVTTARPR